MKKIIFTTSWDDGHIEDFKVSKILEKYGVKGTFYIAQKHSRGWLAPNDILKLSKLRNEIGAHTLTHPELDKIGLQEARKEILVSKEYLENIINKKVEMFCYPRGKYNDEIKKIVMSGNFSGARTTSKFQFKIPDDHYEFGVSLHLYPFPFRKKDTRILWAKSILDPARKNFSDIRALKLPLSSWISWQNLSKNLFDYAQREGEIFHLYGHSWEIERYKMWGELENFLKYIKQNGSFIPLTNSEALRYFK